MVDLYLSFFSCIFVYATCHVPFVSVAAAASAAAAAAAAAAWIEKPSYDLYHYVSGCRTSNMYTCQQCTKTFHWPGDLKRHITIKHSTTNVEHAEAAPAKRLKMQNPLQLSSTPVTFQHPFTMTISGPTSSGKPILFVKCLRVI